MQRLTKNSLLLATALSGLSGVSAPAAVTIYGGPGYDGTISGAGGAQLPTSPQNAANNAIGMGVTSGAAIGDGYIYYNNPNGTPSGFGPSIDSNDKAAYVLTATAPGYVRLASAATNAVPNGSQHPLTPVPAGVTANAINGNYVAGSADTANNTTTGGVLATTAAVWNSTTGAITQLPTISSYTISVANGTAAIPAGNYSATNQATVINSGGTAAGLAILYATGPNGEPAPNNNFQTQEGLRPVRWDNVGGVYTASQLAISGTNSSTYTTGGVTYTVTSTGGTANAINTAGQVAGGLNTYSAAHTYLGTRATFWDAGSAGVNGVTLLPSLSTNSTGFSDQASVMNDHGVIGGTSTDASFNIYAVRWNSPGLTATPDKLVGTGTSSSGSNSGSSVFGINTAGDMVGQAFFYDTNHTLLGSSGTAAIWKMGTTTGTQLSLTAGGTTYGYSIAYAVNDSDVAVGRLSTSASSSTFTAALWGADGSAQTLISLLSASDLATATTGGWTRLIQAGGISNDGYVSGYGMYDPDGTSGSVAAYQRAFLIAVPEPGSLLTVASCGLFALRRRRARTSI